MSDEIEIRRWNTSERSIAILARMHIQLGRMSGVSEYLIYEDQNFPDYLTRVVDSAGRHAFLYLADPGPESGFCHVVVKEDNLFLNNIYVDERFQGLGLGSKLLRKSLQHLGGYNYSEIHLDLFDSNTRAGNWYLHMGFTPRQQTVWKFVGAPVRESSSNELRLLKDANGFHQIYVGSFHAGSRINNHALLWDPSFSSLLGKDYFDQILVKTERNRGYDEPGHVIETSTRCTAAIADVLSYLSQNER